MHRFTKNLLSVQVDLNGDGNITTLEMLQALSYRSISSIPTIQLWCETAVRGSVCYDPVDPGYIETSVIFDDMVNNFLTSSQHTFDGSGNTLVASMASTFPNASWPDSQCQQSNLIFHSNTQVLTNWALLNTFPVLRVCGYVNANLSAAFTTTNILSGSQTYYTDNYVGARQNYKRIYCIAVDYLTGCTGGGTLSGTTCSLGTPVRASAYSCSIGLFYVSVGCIYDLQICY